MPRIVFDTKAPTDTHRPGHHVIGVDDLLPDTDNEAPDEDRVIFLDSEPGEAFSRHDENAAPPPPPQEALPRGDCLQILHELAATASLPRPKSKKT
jgi:hypothetical protein